MHDVIAIGSATRDNFLKANFKTVPWKATPSKKAYALPVGEKLEVEGVVLTIGGNAANGSVTFARQGLKTACVAKIGCDFAGVELKRKLRAEEVNTDLIACAPDLPTAFSALLLQEGERTILGYHGAADSFTIRDLDLPRMAAKWWYMSLAGESDKMLKPLLKFSRAQNIAVAFNPSGHHLRHRKAEIISSFRDIDFFVVNDEEAALITGIPWRKEKEVFKKLEGFMPGILAVTEGSRGVTVSDSRHIYKAGIFKEKKLVDRTGAGDAFGSGFVAGLLRRGVTKKNIGNAKPEDVMYAIRLATANATAKVEEIGATEGLLTKKTFEDTRWKNLPIKVIRLKV
jgi:ribokinase